MTREQKIIISPKPEPTHLPDRLETAIEETTTGMGALVTQVIRHSLYTGVQALQDRLQELADDRVDAAVANRLPSVERSAEEVAERVARQHATEAAQEQIVAVQGALCGQIETRTAQLADRIDATGNEARQAVTAVRGDISAELAEVESRVQLSATDLVGREIEALRQAARGTAAGLRKELAALRVWTENLDETFQQEKELRQIEQQSTTTAVQQQFQALARRLEAAEERARQAERQAERQAAEALARLREELCHRLDALGQQTEALRARVAELEKPRGVRAVWQRFFGRPADKPES